jgi:hypothetical protein
MNNETVRPEDGQYSALLANWQMQGGGSQFEARGKVWMVVRDGDHFKFIAISSIDEHIQAKLSGSSFRGMAGGR